MEKQRIKQKTRQRIIAIVCLLLAAGALAAAVLWGKSIWNPPADRTAVPYAEFHKQLEDGNIESVLITQSRLEFRKANDPQAYETENPGAIDLKERLLLAGVTVQEARQSSWTAILDLAFDALFVLFLIGLAYKFAGDFFRSFPLVRHTGVHFSDIAGMERQKQELRTAVDILKHADKYRKQGIRPTKGIILEGPPGNGKTLFARALAEEAGVHFIAAKGADFQSMLMSIGPRKIKQLFKKARRHKPCIIFIDEFDGIGERRSYAGTGLDKENNRMITVLLNEMDGFAQEDGVLVIAATNSYASLDAALVRPGRFDLKYKIPNPDQETREELIRLYTKGLKLAPSIRIHALAHGFGGLSCATIETILNESAQVMLSEGKQELDVDCIADACRKMGLLQLGNPGGRRERGTEPQRMEARR